MNRIDEPSPPPELTLDPSQQRAVELLCEADVGLLTGGPGTGKTTTLRTALHALEAPGAKVALASPTGKAARRLQQVTGRPASTLHRLLGYQPGGEGAPLRFDHNAEHPLPHDAVFVDEASMLDIELAEKLLDAIGLGTRLVLVGDVNQLPSVGPGRFFADLIESGVFPVVRLEEVHRAAARSWVCTQAPRILCGEMPDLGNRADFRWVERHSIEQTCQALVEVVTGRLPDFAGITQDDIQVLAPQKVGPAGTHALNKRLQAVLNPEVNECAPSWTVGDARLRPGDRVIQTENDYERDLMNGELGRVGAISPQELHVDFESGPQVFARQDLRGAAALRLAYALTVHKYQGSEVPWVVMLCHSTHTRMLTRRLLYTAVTRAKKGVVLVGDALGLERALKNTRDDQRRTTMQQLLRGEVPLDFDDPDARLPLEVIQGGAASAGPPANEASA